MDRNYEPKAKVTVIRATSRASVKIRDNFYTESIQKKEQYRTLRVSTLKPKSKHFGKQSTMSVIIKYTTYLTRSGQRVNLTLSVNFDLLSFHIKNL